jgi:polar amino acid transport system ATP-binding protein
MQVTCTLGPSGSGKSTLLRFINGLEAYQSERILFVGTLVDRQSPSIWQPRRRMPIVFQWFNLFPHRTALEYVTEAPIHVHGGSPSGASGHRSQIPVFVDLSQYQRAFVNQHG